MMFQLNKTVEFLKRRKIFFFLLQIWNGGGVSLVNLWPPRHKTPPSTEEEKEKFYFICKEETDNEIFSRSRRNFFFSAVENVMWTYCLTFQRGDRCTLNLGWSFSYVYQRVSRHLGGIGQKTEIRWNSWKSWFFDFLSSKKRVLMGLDLAVTLWGASYRFS